MKAIKAAHKNKNAKSIVDILFPPSPPPFRSLLVARSTP